MNDSHIEKLLEKRKIIGEDVYYTLKDRDSGAILPLAGLWKSDGYGKEEAEARAVKIKVDVVLVRMVEI